MYRLITILGLLITPLLSPAQVYQWTDEHGNTHFSDEAPQKENVRQLERPRLVNSPLPRVEVQRPEASSSEEQRQRRGVRASQQENAQERRCESYRTRKERINKRLRSGYREPRGNQLRRQRRELRALLYQEC